MSSRIIDSRSDLAREIETLLTRVIKLRRDLGKVRPHAMNVPGGDLVDLDIGRAEAGVFAALVALERAGRHARLEP